MESKRSYKIADTVITLDWSRSRIPPETKKDAYTDGFITKGRRESDLYVYVEYGYTQDIKREHVFITEKDWALSKVGRRYVYETSGRARRGGVLYFAILENNFKRARLFIGVRGKRKKAGGMPMRDRWSIGDVMINFIQVFLLNYLAHNKKGVIVHSSALKFKNNTLGFLGRHEAGKSTMARLWKEHSKDIEIFNDDRCVITRKNGKFKIYSTPWPGTFSQYELTHKEADLHKIYFIHHSKANRLKKISQAAAFMRIMQNIFPPFWSHKGMKFVLSFCHDFAKKILCYDLDFINDKSIISFLKKKI